MSKSSKPTNDWDKIWQEYSKVFEKWKEVFETFQNTTLEMQKKYNEVMGIAANESSKDTMKQFGENWQKAMSKSGVDTFKQFSDNWEKAINQDIMINVNRLNKYHVTYSGTENNS